MKFTHYVPQTINIKTISHRHAVYGEIITTKEVFRPYFVINSFFEPRFIEKYGINSEEILKHGTGYVDCLTGAGQIIRLQYYEYVIVVNGKRYEKMFRKKFPILDDEDGFAYKKHQFLEPADESIIIY